MIHAYNKLYLNTVMENIAALFDIAINAEGFDPDEFSYIFANSSVAKKMEAAHPDYLAGKSAGEMLSIIFNRQLPEYIIPQNRTPEYWAGWVLANAQWSLNRSFKEIIDAFSFSKLLSLYHPYHEADESKAVELIKESMPQHESKLKTIRKASGLTQQQLAVLSDVNVRSIRSYEQGDNELYKAQGEILYKLAKALNCRIEDLL